MQARTNDSGAPTLDSLFEYADFGPWVRQLVVASALPFHEPATPLHSELESIVANRLTARALATLKAATIDVPPADAERLRSIEFATSVQSLHARLGGARACAELSKGGVDPLVVKGPAIARHYREPRLRAYTDLDLLVSPRQFGRSLHILQAAGWQVKETYPRSYFPRWCVEGANLERDGGDRVDLHHHVPPWAWGRGLPFRDLWRRSDEFELEGEAVRCASVEDNLLIAALHIVSDRSRPGRTPVIWQDLVELSHAVDVDRLVALARTAQLGGWLARVLAALPDGSVPANLLAELGADEPSHPRRLAALMDVAHTGRRPTREWAARLPALSGLAYLAAVIAPSRTFVRDAQGASGYLSYWRSLVRPDGASMRAFRP